jgi:thiamine biosynthesis lipoprotein
MNYDNVSCERFAMNRKVALAVVLVVCLCLLAVTHFACTGKGRVDENSGVQLVMGTFARIVAVAGDSETARQCIEAGMAEIHRVDELMSDYKSDSDIGRANTEAAEKPVQVSESTYEVLQRSVGFSKLTGGAFDVTVGPLVDLFRTAKKEHVAPTQEQIASAKSKVGFEKLTLDDPNRTVRFAVEGMRLDLGGIAKGYAIDKAIEAAQRGGATGTLVDIGGDIRCFGTPPEGKDHWIIGVQDPNSAVEGLGEGGVLLKLKVNDAAVATSGDYQQFVVIEGRKYSHIINRKTGTSAEGLSSVTIIANNATDADALATAVTVMGAKDGLALIEKLPNTEAILISSGPKYEITKSPGAGKYIAGASSHP